MDTEQQRKWAYIALRASAVPPPPSVERLAGQIVKQMAGSYNFHSMPFALEERIRRSQAPFIKVISATQTSADFLSVK